MPMAEPDQSPPTGVPTRGVARGRSKPSIGVIKPPVVVAATLLAVCACSPAAPQLVNPAAGTMIKATMPDTVANQPYTFSDWPLCVDKPGRVVVISANVINPHGLVLHRFGTRPNPIMHSTTFRSLWRSGFGPGPQVVDTVCHPNRAGARVGFEFYRRPGMTGTGEGVRLRYRTDDGLHSVTVRYYVTLCKPADTTGTCYHDPRPDPHARGIAQARRHGPRRLGPKRVRGTDRVPRRVVDSAENIRPRRDVRG